MIDKWAKSHLDAMLDAYVEGSVDDAYKALSHLLRSIGYGRKESEWITPSLKTKRDAYIIQKHDVYQAFMTIKRTMYDGYFDDVDELIELHKNFAHVRKIWMDAFVEFGVEKFKDSS